MKNDIQKECILFQGKDKWHTNEIDGKEITMHDGPNGLRIEVDDSLGFPVCKPSISYPTESLMGCSFDRELLKEYGNILAEECIQSNTDILLGPGINHKRSPLGGRNFEYFSEDPILSGELATSYINGVQEKGIGVSLKHFATNNREFGRMVCDSVIDERTLHELYLKQFEITVRKSHPYTIMNSYNKLNGIHCTEHKQLMDEARSWGFDGVFVSDWGAVYDPVASLKAGLNLEMPGGNIGADQLIYEAIKKGELEESVLHQSNQYLRKLAMRCSNKNNERFDRQKHLQFAKKAAEESIVLLKNDNILPLKKEESILVVGPFAKYTRYKGAGSSGVTSSSLDNIFSSMRSISSKVTYVDGYHMKYESTDETLITEAVKNAEKNEKIVIVLGLPEGKETEGMDRKTLSLPENQLELVKKIKQVNDNIIIILQTGSPVLLPFRNDVKGILLTYFAGARSGQATCSILYGDVCPSGKLAETWPHREKNVPAYKWFMNDRFETQYRETIYSGYRYYDTFGIPTEFDFGFGLSYTTFQYSNLNVEINDQKINTTITIKNTGSYIGKEIVQVYMSLPDSKIARSNHELIDFSKVELKPNEEKTITIQTELSTLNYYDVKEHKWDIEEGNYIISVGTSLKELSLHQSIYVSGNIEPYSTIHKDMFHVERGVLNVHTNDFVSILEHPLPPKRQAYPFTPDTTIGELQEKKLGKVIYKIAKRIAKSGFVEGMDESALDDTCIRQMIWLEGINWKTVELGVSYMNKHHFQVLKKLMKSIEK